MAKILPRKISNATTSNAEKKIFNLLKEIDEGWIVFHSLGISDHVDKIFGEADFVIITYDGILCLEVKGGRIERKDGSWYYINRHGERFYNHEGPFKQAINSMHSIRNYVIDQLDKRHDLSKCQYASGVMFPDIKFEEIDPEIIDEIIYDRNYPATSEGLKRYINDCFKYWRNKINEKHGIKTGYLNDTNLSRAQKILRGDFGVVSSLKADLEELDEALIELTKEQYKYLSMLNQNPRFIISGRAGTGKTLIGVEHAKRLAVKGKKVLILFYNKLIAHNIKEEFNDEELENIDIFNFHNFINEIVLKFKEEKTQNYDRDYFTEKLPSEFLDYVGFSNYQNFYDVIIVDEGQDLIKNNYLFCMDEILKGGLDDGNWLFFHDPAQNIYNDEFEESLKLLENYRPVSLKLTINCRNTREIGDYNTSLTEFDTGEEFRIDGGEVKLHSYKNQAEQRRKVLNTVKSLLSEGIKPGEIVILSQNKFENSFFEDNNIFKDLAPFVDLTKDMSKYHSEEYLKFSTIHSFKGLESNVIILTDFDDIKSNYSRLINYTAISRAKIILHVFHNEISRLI